MSEPSADDSDPREGLSSAYMFEVYCPKFDDWFSVPNRSGRNCSWCGEPLDTHPTEKELLDAYYDTDQEATVMSERDRERVVSCECGYKTVPSDPTAVNYDGSCPECRRPLEPAVEEAEGLQGWTDADVDEVDAILEYLSDNELLNSDGEDVKSAFWRYYISDLPSTGGDA